MANYSNLKASISAAIKANGNNEITGDVLQNALLTIIDNLGKYGGLHLIATPETVPGTPDEVLFYVTSQPGVYSNFQDSLGSPIVVNPGEVVLLKYFTSWNKIVLNNVLTTSQLYSIGDFYTSLGYINRSNGSVEYSAGYKVTPFMKLGTEPIYISRAYQSGSSTGAAAVSFFDADKNYLGEYPVGTTGTINNINIPVSSFPAGAAYFRTNAAVTDSPVITGSSKVMDFIKEVQNSLDLNRIDNAPFEKNLPYVEASKFKSILNLYIADDTLDMTKRYYLQFFGFNRPLAGKYRHYFGVSEVGTSGNEAVVTSLSENQIYAILDTAEPISGIRRFPLFRPNSDVNIGYVDINVDEAFSGNYYTGSASNALLRQSVFHNPCGDTPVPTDLPTKDTHRLLLPDDIYFLDDNKLPIFQRSCVSNESDLDKMNFYVGRIDGDFPHLQQIYKNGVLNPDDFDSSLRIAAKYGADYNSEIIAYYKDLNVKKTSSSSLTGKTATVILSGDSITDFDITKFVGQKFENLGVTLSYQGTLNDGVPYYNEGRASWEYRHFFGKMTKRHGPGGAAIVPQPTGTTSTLNQNPFIRVATPAEIVANPQWCFENHAVGGGTGRDNEKNYIESQLAGGYTGDYYTVSIIDYIANHGITVGDKLIWISNWGFNDLNHWNGSEAVIQDALMGMEILASRLKDYALANPSKTVILGISPLLIVQIYNKWDKFSSYLERGIKKVKELNSSLGGGNFKIDLVPVWISVDRSFGWDYPVSGSNVFELSADNNTKYSTPVDTIHPGDVGKHQISNVIVNYIAYNL